MKKQLRASALFALAVGLAALCINAQVRPRRHESAIRSTWNNVRIVAGGFITAIIPDPALKGVIFVRTDIGGSYRRDPATGEFVPLNDFNSPKDWNLMGTESIAIDPTDPQRFYLANGTYVQSFAGNGAIFRTEDGGATFHRANLPIQLGSNENGRYAGERLAVDPLSPNILYLGTRLNGLWRSTNYGDTWSQVSSFPVTGQTSGVGVVFVIFNKTGGSSEAIYAGVSDSGTNLYRSNDGGGSWQPVPGQPAGMLPNHAVIASDGNMYLSYADQPGADGMGGAVAIRNGAIWKYKISSGNWTNITPPAYGGSGLYYGFGEVAADAQHPSTIMVSTLDRWSPGDTLYRSTDGGSTWVSLGPEPAAGTNYSTRDISLSPWLTFGGSGSSFGWWIGSLAIDPFDSNHVLYGTGATIYATDEVTNVDSRKTVHWTVGALGIEETAVLDLISPPAGAHLLSAVGDIGGFRHDDLTVSPPAGMYTNPVFTTTQSLAYAANKPNIVARLGSPSNNGTQYGAWSQDGGSTWSPFATTPSAASFGVGSIAISADGSTFVWSPSTQGTSWSRDNGNTWTGCSGVPGGAPAIADRVNPSKFYAFNQASGVVFLSTDAGATFTGRANGLPGGSLHAAPGLEGDLWLATQSGIFHSSDSGATFANIGTVQQAYALGFGKGEPGRGHPSLFASAQIGGVQGIFWSTDAGRTWLRMNDDRHQWGTVNVITGDPRIFGRVYLGTNGRGILYADTPWAARNGY